MLIAQYTSRASRAGSALTSPTWRQRAPGAARAGRHRQHPTRSHSTDTHPCTTEQQGPSYRTARSAIARTYTLLPPRLGFYLACQSQGPLQGAHLLPETQHQQVWDAVGTEPPPRTGQIAPPLFAECSPTGSSGYQQLGVNAPPASYLCTPPARLFAARRQKPSCNTFQESLLFTEHLLTLATAAGNIHQ